MEFEYVFFLIFGVVIANLVFKMVKHRGMRGALFGARVMRTVGEVDLGHRGMVRTKLKVHCFEPSDPGSPSVGVELVAASFGGFGMTPIPLTREQARALAAFLTQAVDESGTQMITK